MDTPPVVLLVQAPPTAHEKIEVQFRTHAPSQMALQTVSTLEDALNAIEQVHPAAILLDLELPETHDLDAFITLHFRAPEIPILAFAEQVSLERGLAVVRAGAQDCLTRAELESPRLGRLIAFAIERQLLRHATHSHAEQLQFSEARFRLLINENPDAILVVNAANVIRFANPAAATLFGSAREELVGTVFSPTLDANGVSVSIARNGETILAQPRQVKAVWNGEDVRIVTLRDVASAEHMADLYASQERYREFIAQSSEGIWRSIFQTPISIHAPIAEQVRAIFADAPVVECNHAFVAMYGRTDPAEMLGRVILDDLSVDDAVNQATMYAFVLNDYQLNDGETHEFDIHGQPKIFLNNLRGIVRDEFLIGMWGTQRDVTAEKQAYMALERAEHEAQHQSEKVRALADSAVVLNSTLSYEQVLDRILENVGQVVPHDAASIFLMQEGIGRFVRGKGFAERQLQEMMEHLQLNVKEVPGYQGMVDTGKPLLIPDTAEYADWKQLTGNWIKSYVGTPLRVQDKTIGFLSLDSVTPNFFNATHAADLQAFAAQAATALENARLHAQVQQRADEFAELYDLTRELAMQRDLDALLELLLERAMKLLSAPCGAVALSMPPSQELQVRVMIGGLHSSDTQSIRMGEGLMGQVAWLRQPLILEDYRAWERRLPQLGETVISAVIGVPMLFGGELVGVLAVHEEGDTTRRFTQADAQLLTLLATQAAALVHNARLYQETEKRAQQMGLLYDAGLTLNSVLEPKTQLGFLVQIAMRSVRAEFAVFFRYNDAARELWLEFGVGFTVDKPYDYLEQVPLDAKQGIEAWVARERVPALLNDAPADARFAVGADRIASGIWVPIEHDNRLLGVLGVCSTEPNGFNAHDERLLLLFASQAAVAMENARLYQDALEAKERRDVLHWASQEIISAGLDAERVYSAIHQAVTRLMPCEALAIAVLDEQGEMVDLPYLFDRQGRHPAGRIKKTQGLTGHVLRTGQALMVDDLAASGIQAVNIGYPVQVTSVLAVPLRHGGQVLGMLSTQSYAHAVYTVDDRVMLEMLAAHAAAALMNVRGAETMLQSLERAYLETALALAKTIDTRDSYTGAHSDRISDFAVAVGRELQLNEEDINALRLGARLHDIGKIGVPDEILRKPGPLNDAEWNLMRRHPEVGAEILALVRPLQKVIPIVRHHQERFDGTGYPDGLAGEKIPLGARVLAVVDAFSAMTDDRAYRQGRSVEEALAELRQCAGTQFDPNVVQAFLKIWTVK